jgi:hypothetical protein
MINFINQINIDNLLAAGHIACLSGGPPFLPVICSASRTPPPTVSLVREGKNKLK